jgi:hypothetical protein
MITPLARITSASDELARVAGRAQYPSDDRPNTSWLEAAMTLRGAAIGASILLITSAADTARAEQSWRVAGAQQEPHAPDTRDHLTGRAVTSAEAIPSQDDQWPEVRRNDFPVTVRPGTLALFADTLAGRSIRLASARVVGVFDSRVFLVDTRTPLPPIVTRDRVLVFIETGTLRVDPAVLVASTVTLSGVARTLLGMQVSRDVPWPAMLTPDAVKRLDIRAAILASSVRTPEGIDLVARSSSASTPAKSSPLGR